MFKKPDTCISEHWQRSGFCTKFLTDSLRNLCVSIKAKAGITDPLSILIRKVFLKTYISHLPLISI